MLTIQEIFGHNPGTKKSRPHPSFVSPVKVGVEVELERVYHTPSLRGWRVIADGSLRNSGKEFVFNGPAGGMALNNRLNTLDAYLRGLERPPEASNRTSIHVHLDVRDLAVEEVWKLLITYGVVEAYLFKLCNEDRAENIYSCSWQKAQDQLEALAILRNNIGHARDTSMFPKYASVNIHALVTHGTLEFRGHEGTCDVERIRLWINHLLCLREFAKDVNTGAEEIPALMSALGAEKFLKILFGPYYQEVGEDVHRNLYTGAMNAEEVLFSSRHRQVQRDIFREYGGEFSSKGSEICVD